MPTANTDTTDAACFSAGSSGRPLLLLVGSGSEHWRAYVLRSMASGYRLHLLCPAPPTWEKPYIDSFGVVDTLDVAAMTAAARAHPERFAGVLTYEETRVEAVAELATVLGLRTSPREAVRACRDKYAGRKALDRAGVPQARSAAVASLAEASEAAARIGYPVVVKPRALSASCGATYVGGERQLARAYQQAGRIWFDEVPRYAQPTLVEEYLDGPEISVEAVCRDGQVTALFVAHKQLGYAPGFQEVGHTVRADDPLLSDDVLLKVVQNAHTAVGLTDTVTHTELRLTSSGPKVVEINARIGGGRVPYLGGLVTGLEIGRMAADLAVGATPDFRTSGASATAAVRFLYPEREVRVESVEFAMDRLPPEIREVRALTAPGRELRLYPPGDSRSRYALLVAVAETERDCTAALERAADAVTLHGTPLS
ncbi:ATP-grasp domain-containing protein [Streptomyces sp. NPDC045470]|uniref:ATP-grasp domain-containing protein n=1 Tax=Streptomyces sp. NPDC045470 TaxID=3155469 RepID=UPI0033DE0638